MSTPSENRLLTVDPNDHSAWLWITCVIGLLLIFSAASYRVMQRWQIWKLDSFDDHLAALTFVRIQLSSAVSVAPLNMITNRSSPSSTSVCYSKPQGLGWESQITQETMSQFGEQQRCDLSPLGVTGDRLPTMR